MHCKLIVQSLVSLMLPVSAMHTPRSQQAIQAKFLPILQTKMSTYKGSIPVKGLLLMIDCHCSNQESKS